MADDEDKDEPRPEDVEVTCSGGIALPPLNTAGPPVPPDWPPLETSPDWAGPIHWKDPDGE